MALSRRHLLAAPAALAATALLPGPLLAAVAAQTSTPPDLSDWEAVRAQFALDPAYLHFASFFIASHPAPVREALEGYRRAIDANPFLFVERAMFEDDAHNLPLQVCTEAADYLGGRANEVCLTRSTTEGLALVYYGLPLKAGDEVLTTIHDHYSHHESIRLATARANASMRKIALFASSATASVDEIVGNLRAAVRPATRVVGVTWVHSSTGIRLPIREIAAMLRDLPSPPLLVVDGVHGLGATDETVATMGADYFCAGCHKWMFAPYDCAALLYREPRLAKAVTDIMQTLGLQGGRFDVALTPLEEPQAHGREQIEFLVAGHAGVRVNADAEGAVLEDIASPDSESRDLLSKVAERFGLTARGYHRVLRVARTIADLDGENVVQKPHIAEADRSTRRAQEGCG